MYNYTNITRYEDLIGKKLRLNGTDYTVSAIVDTGLDMSRYSVLAEAIDYNDAKTVVRNMILQQERIMINSTAMPEWPCSAGRALQSLFRRPMRNMITSRLNLQ